MQGAVRQIAVYRSGYVHCRKVEIVSAAGGEGELLWGNKLRRQRGYDRRNAFTGGVQVSITAKPHKVAACISVRAGQTVGRRRGKALAAFHNDLNILRAITQLPTAKVEGNGFQPVIAQRAGVQDFKDGAETEEREGERSIGAGIVAGQIVPAAKHTVR